MLRIGKPIGFIIGLTLGIKTRDFFIYPYPLRAQDMEEDFNRYTKQVEKVEKQTKRKIKKMRAQLDKAQGIYMTKKHEQFEKDSDLQGQKESIK